MARTAAPHVKDSALVEVRRREIAETALQLFRTRGYHATTVREIAEAVGISVGSLFNYFRSKEQILQAIYDATQEAIEQALQDALQLGPDPVKAFELAVDRYFTLIDRHHDHTVLVYQEFKSLDGRAKRQVIDRERRIMDIFRRILESGIERGVFRPHPVAVTVNALAALGHMWATRRWALRGAVTLDEYKRAQLSMILDGVRRTGHGRSADV
jgi:AcrR family transcriptional regulator